MRFGVHAAHHFSAGIVRRARHWLQTLSNIVFASVSPIGLSCARH
jgi:hypothetical protein